MIIQDRERMAAPGARISEREVALEIHLPQQVGRFMLKALAGSIGAAGRALNLPTMAAQDGIDGAGMRQVLLGQQRPQLATAPAGIKRMQGQHLRFELRGGACR